MGTVEHGPLYGAWIVACWASVIILFHKLGGGGLIP